MNLLTIEEAAEVLKINKHTAYRYAKTGAIPAVRIGRSWRVDKEVLNDWLVKRSGKTTGAWKRRKPEGKKKSKTS